MTVLYTNNAVSTLLAGITAGATSLTVQAGDGALFPNPTGGDNFFVTLADAANNIEIVEVTGRTGDVFTIVRAQEGTSANAYLAGDSVGLRLTAGGLNNFAQIVDAVMRALPATKSAGDLTFSDNVQVNIGDSPDGELYSTGTVINFDVNGGVQVIMRDGASGNANRFTFDITSGDLTLDGYLDAEGGTPQEGDLLAYNASNTRFEPITFAGMVAAFAMVTVPSGWLYADGSDVSRTTYARLFAVIGETYGNGDGSTTFTLPDYRGRFLRSQDDGAGVDPDAGSRNDRGDGVTGDFVGTKQGDQFESHRHDTNIPQTASSTGAGGASGSPSGPDPKTSFEGGNETRPKNINVRYYIKT